MDWVKSCFECSVDQTLRALTERVKADIGSWIARGGNEQRITVSEDGGGRLTVRMLHQFGTYAGVTLSKEEDSLLVRSAPSNNLPEAQVKERKLHPTVNEKGECRLMCENKELELWQASRLMLEPLLFRSPKE